MVRARSHAALQRDAAGLNASLASVICVPLVACAAACGQPRAELLHLTDMPSFEGGRTPQDCDLMAEDEHELQSAEHRCVVFSQSEGREFFESYVQALHARGWTRGGAEGSAMWVFIPMERDCAQVYSIVGSDWPRSSHTTDTSEIVFDLILDQRLRCGEELKLQ